MSGYRANIGAAVGLQTAFTRDDLGRITRKVETVGGVTTTTDYGYGLKGQLTTVTENGVRVQTYAYDPNGNRLSLTTPTGVERCTYDAQDRLLAYGTKTYSYTLDGSLRSVVDSATGERTDYTYDGFENLTRVALPDGRVIEYLIDGQNRRVGKKVDGVLTQGLLYDGQLTPVAQIDASGNVVARFVFATGVNVPAYMIKGGVTYRLVTDHLGSVRLVVNAATGEVAQRLDYDAFGRVLVDSNPGLQPFGYAGGLYDADTGLVRFGARDFDSISGKWLTKDPIGFAGGTNQYAYVHNAPVQAFDPTGLIDNELFTNYIQGLLNSPHYPIDRFQTSAASGVAEPSFLSPELLLGLPGLARSFVSRGAIVAEGELCEAGLSNPFKGKSVEQIDKMFRKKGFELRGPNPISGKGGYVNPRTLRSYHIDEANRFGESAHVDVNRLRDFAGNLTKKKYPF